MFLCIDEPFLCFFSDLHVVLLLLPDAGYVWDAALLGHFGCSYFLVWKHITQFYCSSQVCSGLLLTDFDVFYTFRFCSSTKFQQIIIKL